ncbi:serine hydrolase domain-containing protein [Nocardia sp. NPDC058176]|uniref:serine hydrolase domain-containing protein n=1 Tax=Nocardia sp. NPDC058176 TaxID=3346368 RepID=UPI0036D9C4E4
MPSRPIRGSVGVILVAAALVATACQADESSGERAVSTSNAPHTDERGPAALTRALEQAVAEGIPGAQAVVTDRGGTWSVSAGAGDRAAGTPFPDNSHYRIGSNTKTFVSTVVLQLVAEGKVDLDAPIERYLPGVVHGNGSDGTRITVRNLLQHTSGIPDYLIDGDAPKPGQITPTVHNRWQRFTSDEELAIALALPAYFEPGTKFQYTNTNFLLAGMIVQKVTGRSVAAEITGRIIEPLALHGTSFPGPDDTALPDPHPIAYADMDGTQVDITQQNTTWAGAAGAMISTGADMNTFLTALLTGELLPQPELDELMRTIPTDKPDAEYGLGINRVRLSCGIDAWGHTGGLPGFRTLVRYAPSKDRAVTMAFNELPATPDAAAATLSAMDTALCDSGE